MRTPSSPPAVPAIELKSITKRFGTVVANRDVSLRIAPGSIHGIVGENGAGKSTLMSILYGFYQADAGEILVHGNKAHIRNSTDAIGLGIGMVHQHFMLVETMSGLENVLLGAEGGFWLTRGRKVARAKLEQLMRSYHLPVALDEQVQSMTVGEQQRLEILKALFRDARILILDEPTAVLTPQEVGQLFTILRELRDQGVTVVIITHKLQEIMELTDEVTVMRAGQVVAQRHTAEVSREQLTELMIGRPVALQIERKPLDRSQAPVRLSVRDLGFCDSRGCHRLQGVDLDLHAGEILGVAGVSGNGQTELLAALAGMLQPQQGRVVWDMSRGRYEWNATRWMPAHALRRMGAAHVPEDRIGEGLLKNFSMQETAILGYQNDAELGSRAWLSPAKVKARCEALIRAFDVRPPLPSLRTANMSGGNQQRLVLSREMARVPEVLLVGQPTRGVDLGAIERIYREVLRARDEGAAILLVSVELEELFALSDRIMVMNEGRVTGVVDAATASPQDVGLLMTAQEAHA